MKQLPIGIQDFEKIILNDFLYVDKTEQYFNAFQGGTHFFLSRPRRFGKSLLLSTMKYLYQGRKDLFKGLWIEDKWDWEKIYPVIHIDLNKIDTRKSTLEYGLMLQLQEHASFYNKTLNGKSSTECFVELMSRISTPERKCVLLVDEYDKPITDYINQPDISDQHIKELKGFYGQIKSMDTYIHKTIITGVSRYGKISIFSDLNNLNDLSMNEEAAKTCGYTQEELEFYFQDYIQNGEKKTGFSRTELLKNIQNWYNGYVFDFHITAKLYNPFSILNFFSRFVLQNFWFETGTPTFLTKLIAQEKIDPARLEYLKNIDITFKSADLRHLDVLSLLYQTGYLTIKDITGPFTSRHYILGFPNQEVRLSFMSYLLAEYAQSTPSLIGSDIIVQIQDALWVKNWDNFFKVINQVFAQVPYNLFVNNEAYYHSLVHVTLTLTGHIVLSEVLTSKGRIDTVLETDDFVVIFEFKMDSSPEIALAQIHEKRYAERYAKKEKELILIGVNFDSKERKIINYKCEV